MDIKSWQQKLPDVGELRPGRCPGCEAASSPVGGPLALHGHGTRQRQLCGPVVAGQPPELGDLTVRRYRCVRCRAVIVVVPRTVLRYRRYSSAAIAYALALWGLVLATAAHVRRLVNPARVVGSTAAGGWATLRRWARAVWSRQLFGSVPLPGPGSTWRQVAASAAAAVAAWSGAASRSTPIEQRAFAGAGWPR